MTKILAFILSLILCVENIPMITTPKLVIDANKPIGEVSTKATGFLYGLSEPGVPSDNMTDSLDISSVSQKVIGGLQHPTGDVDRVSAQLSECDYQVVYLQDAYDTWYYNHKNISEMRKNGTYDWEKFLEESYFPIVREKVLELESKPYADKLVYCIYNECDNGIWFGTDDGNGNGMYDEEGKKNFFEAWKRTYELVKALAPEAKIGGPGFFDYNTEKITDFLTFTKENACVPEIMIYHELNPWSAVDWENHVKDYRGIEKNLGIDELTIIVTEYGTMEECGNPAAMIHYITAVENTGTYANMAFWRLANNLNDTCSDDNTPNSNWWLYRKYKELDGQKLETKVSSVKDRYTHDGDWRRSYRGVSVINDKKNEISIIAMGSEKTRGIEVKNLKKTNLSDKVDIKIECVYYNGLNSPVYEPILLRQYTKSATAGRLYFNIPGTDTDAVYFITLSKNKGEIDTVRNTNIPVRYELEEGTLLGTAYTYDSAYATTGEVEGMVGGIEKWGDGVEIKVDIPADGTYKFDVVYGKHNDSGVPHGRDFATANVELDGNLQQIKLSNTIKSEYTNLYTLTYDLTKGKHTLKFTHNNGTYVLDSVIVSRAEEKEEITLLSDGEKNKDFLAVAPFDGYYEVTSDTDTKATVDGISVKLTKGTLLYLRRGLNEIKCNKKAKNLTLEKTDDKRTVKALTPYDFTLKGKAVIRSDKYGNTYVDGISSKGGKAVFTVSAPYSGKYRVTVTYANNSEGGVHDYNVDLIENYITVKADGKAQQVFFRNTFSKYNYKTVTFTLKLNEGENKVTFSNDGSSKFNNMESFAPFIKGVTVNEVTL